jgi:hypothetical protein
MRHAEVARVLLDAGACLECGNGAGPTHEIRRLNLSGLSS